MLMVGNFKGVGPIDSYEMDSTQTDGLLTKETDIAYEQELLRDPFQQRLWWHYIKSKKDAYPPIRFLIYERALKFLPGSYKLWWNYLQDRLALLKSRPGRREGCEALNNAFERCLVHNSRMPRIWMDYCSFLETQKLITRTRRTYDRALRSLPITQHDRIWEQYINFVKLSGVMETSICVYRRYLMLDPSKVEDFIELLLDEKVKRYDEAAVLLSEVVNNESFVSSRGKTNHQLWMNICDLITEHPKEIKSLSIEPIIRSGIRRFSDEVGRLWCSLADHFIRLGYLEKARDIYEEAISVVMSMHDFAMIFDAYVAFEESLLNEKLEEHKKKEIVDPEDCEMDLLISQFEYLMERRAELVSSVKLRQNPHNIYEWINRAALYKDDPPKVIQTFGEAVMTVDPQKVVGKLSFLWIKFASFYDLHEDLENCRKIFEKAVLVKFKTVDELATIWCEWVENELRHGDTERALEIARRAVSQPRKTPDEVGVAHANLHRSVKVWALCADMEESFGTKETLKICFDKMFSLRVITTQMVINYAHYLEEHRFYEESFKAYQRGVSVFKWPHLNDIYLMYLMKFVSRYGEQKLERARDLFEEAVAEVPAQFARRLFLLYAKLEEEFGLAKRALAVYHRACKAVKVEQQLEMYQIYIAKTAELFGIAKSRVIYEEAIDILPEQQARTLSLQYALVEKGLGEIDRARSIYQHASQFCDPSRDSEFWQIWRDFEVSHGNEDTFRDMLRIKRSVQAQYSQIHFNTAELEAEAAAARVPADPMAAAEEELRGSDAQQEEMEKMRDAHKSSAALNQTADDAEEEAEEEDDDARKRKREVDDALEAEREYLSLMGVTHKAPVEYSSDPTDSSAHAYTHTVVPFIKAERFEASKEGYLFKRGELGTGYYLDRGDNSSKVIKHEELEDDQAIPRTHKSKRKMEELDIDMNLLGEEEAIEEKEIPDELFGKLAKKAKEMKKTEKNT